MESGKWRGSGSHIYYNQSINQFISHHSTEARATVRLCRIKEKCLEADQYKAVKVKYSCMRLRSSYIVFAIRLHVMQRTILRRYFCLSVCLSLRLSNVCFVTNERNLCPYFYTTAKIVHPSFLTRRRVGLGTVCT